MEGEGGEFEQPQIVDTKDKFGRETIEFAHGKLAYRDFRPEQLREEQDIPIISIVGLGMDHASEDQETYDQLNKLGQHVIGLDMIGGGKGIKMDGGSSEMNRQGKLLADFINEYTKRYPEVEKVDIMAQSLAALTPLAMARVEPQALSKVRNVMFVSPMGLNEKDGIFDIAWVRNRQETNRNSQLQKTDYDVEREKKIAKDFMRNVKSRPIRTLKELVAMAKANQYPGLEELQTAGVKVGIIQGEDDLLASNEMLWERIGKGYESPFVKSTETSSGFKYEPKDNQEPPPFDVIRETGGGHEILGADPKSFAKKIVQVVDTLNNSPS